MWRENRPKNKEQNNLIARLRLFAALIFLLLLALIYRLYYLQLNQGDWYESLATGQHQVSTMLKADRVKIMLHEKLNDQERLYPLSTNKDFAFLYTVPKDIKDPQMMAEKFFDFFDRATLAEEINTELDKQQANALQHEINTIRASEVSDEDKVSRIKAAQALAASKKNDPDVLELREITIDRLIKERKEEGIKNYYLFYLSLSLKPI